MSCNDEKEPIEHAADTIAHALRLLGNADASSPLGAIEHLAIQVKEGSERIAAALSEIAAAISDHG